MCLICAMAPGANAAALMEDHLSSGAGLNSLAGRASHAPYTWDQISSQLTNGYWTFNGELARSFTLDGTRSLTYDVSRLSPTAATIAQNALGVWSAATGINFVNVGTAPTLVTEIADAAGNAATSYVIGANTSVSGNIGFIGDVDYYRVTLTAGQNYLIGMSGHTAGSNLDSNLSLYDGSGNLIQTVDDPNDPAVGEYLTYTATSTGNYFIGAQGFGTSTGAYELSIQTAAKITFNDMDSTGAYATSDQTGTTLLRSYVNIADNWADLNLNGYMLQTYIHEIGHALGLGHAGNYNGNANWPADVLYDNDSWSASVMSYFDQTQNTFDPNGFAYLAGLMPADYIAIQNLYGAGPSGSQSGNTVWGPNGNVGGFLQQLINMAAGVTAADPAVYVGNDFAFTIYDTGGTDTIDTSVFNVAQTINLNAQTSSVNYASYSSIGGGVGNVVIARGTVIENAIGGSASDTIVGNGVANRLEGRGGVDSLNGGGGNDRLIGGAGDDVSVYGFLSTEPSLVFKSLADGNIRVASALEGTDLLRGIEHLQFTNTTVDVHGYTRNDMNGDGDSDLLYFSQSTGQISRRDVQGGTLISGPSNVGNAGSGNWDVQRTADMNGDGISDLLLKNSATGQFYIWTVNASGVQAGGANIGTIGTNWNIVASGDYNADGNHDILWRDSNNGHFYIWNFNASMQQTGSASLGVLGSNWVGAGNGDFNGDGTSDVLLYNTLNGNFYAYNITNSAISAYNNLGILGTNWVVAGVGNINGDTNSDIILKNTTTGQFYAWLMNDQMGYTGVNLGTIGTDWNIASVSDYNLDGTDDILWRNASTNLTYLWAMDNGQQAATGSGSFGTLTADQILV